MTNVNEKVARCVRILARRLWPAEAKSASIYVECIDGKELEIPIYLGDPLRRARSKKGHEIGTRDPKTKEKLLAAAPGKDEQPINFKKLCGKAGVGRIRNSRTRLHELVDEGKIERIGNDYRKTM